MFTRTDTLVCRETQRVSHDNHRNQTIPKRVEVYESAGVQPVLPNQADAIDYATGRACFQSGQIRILDFKRLFCSFFYQSPRA
jgi:hypothetical protein